MSKINLDHFLVTNAAVGSFVGGQGKLQSARHFIYDRPQSGEAFFGFILFPNNFTGIGLLDKLLGELKSRFEAESEFNERTFENLVGFFNEKINLYAAGHKNKKDLAKFDICLAAMIGEKLYFAPLGNTSAILFRHEGDRTGYYNLIKEASGALPALETLHLKEIISGALTKNNVVVISNALLFDSLSFHDLAMIITNANAHQGVTNLQKHLISEKLKGTFTGFVLETLEPSLLTAAKEKTHIPAPLLGAHSPKNNKKNSPVLLPQRVKDNLNLLWRPISSFATKLMPFFKELSKLLWHLLLALTNFDGRAREHWDFLALAINQFKQRGLAMLQAWSKPKKIFISISLILVIFLGGGLMQVVTKNKAITQEQRFVEKIGEIENRRTEAESAFLFGNKDRSRDLLEEALALLADIKITAPKESPQVEKLKTQVSERLNALWKIWVIDAPEPIVNLKQITAVPILLGALAVDQNQIVTWNAKMIFLIQDGRLIESWNIDNELEATYAYEQGVINFKTTSPDMLLQLSLAEKKIYSVKIDGWRSKLTALAIKNGKLYILSPENLFITKHAPSLTGFAPGSGWLKEAVDVKDGIDLTVDGNIYIANQTGQIKKMYNGRLADFTQEKISPKISTATKLWTSEESRYLYLTEQGNKRLIIFDKKGKIVSQLQFKNLPRIQDFYLFNKEKMVLIFDGEKMYKINLEQYL